MNHVVSQVVLENLSQSQRDRIAHIDFTLMFKGEAVRADLIKRFGIAPAQATKDFTLYRELAPQNIEYNAKKKLHLKGKGFAPLFGYDVVRTLATLSQGYGDGFTGKLPSSFSCEAPYHLNKPSLHVVANITEAIHKGKPLIIDYVSLSSGANERLIVPHTIVDNGLRWHVRAFDRKRQEFRDFVLTRIKNVSLLASDEPKAHERGDCDAQWNQFVDLKIGPHPNIKHKEAIELDYSMKNGLMQISVRAALAGYLLRLWNVDCSDHHSLTGAEYQLALRNISALSGVVNLAIAPGVL